MIRIAALNDDSSEEDDNYGPRQVTTKEAQESEAFTLYNNALALQQKGAHSDAKEILLTLLKHPLVLKSKPTEQKDDGVILPGMLLRYSIFKNLATIESQEEQWESAVKYYLEAVIIDDKDVTVWYKLGIIALKIHSYPLAKHAFEQALECNPRHWLSLDKIITLLYAFNDYASCLYFIARALERDPGYLKGLALRKTILEEHPGIENDTGHFFKNCDPSISSTEVEHEEIDEYVSEALVIREKRKELSKFPPPPIIKPSKPVSDYTWLNLGESLLKTYDYVLKMSNDDRYRDITKPRVTFACRIDLSECINKITESVMPQEVLVNSEELVGEEIEKKNEPDMCGRPDNIDHQVKEDVQVFQKEIGQNSTNEVGASEAVGVEPEKSKESEKPPIDCNRGQMSVGGVKNIEGLDEVHVATINNADITSPDLMQVAAPTSTVEPDKSTEMNVPRSEPIAQLLPSNVQDCSLPKKPFSYGRQSFFPRPRPQLSLKKKSPRSRKIQKKEWWLDEALKRRSSRVKNAVNKKPDEEKLDYQEILKKFLPQSLLEQKEGDEDVSSQESMDNAESGDTTRCESGTESAAEVAPLLTATERHDVRTFVTKYQANCGAVDLLGLFVVALARKADLKWPDDLKAMYLQAFERYQRHFILPNYLCHDSVSWIQDVGYMMLVDAEIRVDRWIHHRSTLQSPNKTSTAQLYGDDPPKSDFIADLEYLTAVSLYNQVMGENWKEFCIRVFWVKARFLMLENKMDSAVDAFEMTTEYLNLASEVVAAEAGQSQISVRLVNCCADNVINAGAVSKQLDSLKRCQSLEEVHRHHDNGDHKQVVELLLQTFAGGGGRRQLVEVGERHHQLLLLQDSLMKLNDTKRCVFWSEESFHEALQHYERASTEAVRGEWTSTMCRLLDGIDTCLAPGGAAAVLPPPRRVVRFVADLLRLLTAAMDSVEVGGDTAALAVTPWIILYRLVYTEEERERASGSLDERLLADDSLEEKLPASLVLLNLAHDYLGRQARCTVSSGRLLLFTIERLNKELASHKAIEEDDEPHPFQEEMNNALEQCFYCLYGHPNKRTKAKHLNDHNAPQVALTWERSVELFEHYKPKSIPEYDSYRTSTVSAELENLLKRISQLIPPPPPSDVTVESVTAYIEGTMHTPPTDDQLAPDNRSIVKELYYLLADYYFKNKEQGKAIKFYILDLTVNPERFDSWAGMALARASKLEQKLNSHELKNEPGLIHKHSLSALRCFKRALSLDPTNSKLWIEHGNLAYQLHSHASRQLKQQTIFPLGEFAEVAAANRKEMLQLAHHCYLTAASCDGEDSGLEEPWLHNYMLGKMSEKMASTGRTRGEPPAPPHTYINHYRKAANYLHEDRAKYPKKITYIYSPPHLAVESLEMHFRVHVSIMKYLLRAYTYGDERSRRQVPFSYLEEVVSEAAKSGFATGREKDRPKRNEKGDEDGADASSGPGAAASTQQHSKGKRRGAKLPDHTYSKHKQLSCSESSQEGWPQDSGVVAASCSSPVVAGRDSPRGASSIPSISAVSIPTPVDRGNLQQQQQQQQQPRNLKSPPRLAPVFSMESILSPAATAPPKLTTTSPSPATPFGNYTQDKEQNKLNVPKVESFGFVPSSTPRVHTLPKIEVEVSPDGGSLPVLDKELPVKTAPMEVEEEPVEVKVKEEAMPTLEKAMPILEKVDSDGDVDKHASREAAENAGDDMPRVKPQEMKDDELPELESAMEVDPIKDSNPQAEISKKGTDEQREHKDKKVTSDLEILDIIDREAERISNTEQVVDKQASKNDGLSAAQEPTMKDVNMKQPTTVPENINSKNSDVSDKEIGEPIHPAAIHPAAKAEVVGGGSEQLSADERYHRLMWACVHALELCLSRFPQHYKAIHRLAMFYFKYDVIKHPEWARDLLMGPSPPATWQQLQHMPCPGLFQDRKNTNFFNGLWRIPIEEIDRSGSFTAHMFGVLRLMVQVLGELRDCAALLTLAQQLGKTPEMGKKYLRDMERTHLSRQSYLQCLEVIEAITKDFSSQGEEEDDKFLLTVHKVWRYGIGHQIEPKRTNRVFSEAFRAIKKSQISGEPPSVLELAIKHCQQLVTVKAAAKAATSSSAQSDGDGPKPGRPKSLSRAVSRDEEGSAAKRARMDSPSKGRCSTPTTPSSSSAKVLGPSQNTSPVKDAVSQNVPVTTSHDTQSSSSAKCLLAKHILSKGRENTELSDSSYKATDDDDMDSSDNDSSDVICLDDSFTKNTPVKKSSDRSSTPNMTAGQSVVMTKMTESQIMSQVMSAPASSAATMLATYATQRVVQRKPPQIQQTVVASAAGPMQSTEGNKSPNPTLRPPISNLLKSPARSSSDRAESDSDVIILSSSQESDY